MSQEWQPNWCLFQLKANNYQPICQKMNKDPLFIINKSSKKLLPNQSVDIHLTLHQKLILTQLICQIKIFNPLSLKLKRHYQSVPLSFTETQVNRKENLLKLSQVKRFLSNKALKRNDSTSILHLSFFFNSFALLISIV